MRRARQGLFQPLPRLAVESLLKPQAVEHRTESQQRIDVAPVIEPGQGEAHVVMFGRDPGHTDHALEHLRAACQAIGESQIVLSVPLSGVVGFTGGCQALEAVLAHRLQHPVARLIVGARTSGAAGFARPTLPRPRRGRG